MSSSANKSKGGDSFADLMSFAGASSRSNNNDAKLTMKERQEKLQAEQAQKRKETNNLWASGLDSLGSIGSLSSTPKPNTAGNSNNVSTSSLPILNPLSAKPAETSRPDSGSSSTSGSSMNPPMSSLSPSSSRQTAQSSGNSNSTANNDLLGFGFPVSQPPSNFGSIPSTSGQNNTNANVANSSCSEQNIDDIFDIFNKPPPPAKTQPEPEIKKPVPVHAKPSSFQNQQTNRQHEQNVYDSDEDAGLFQHNESDKTRNAHKYDGDDDIDTQRRSRPARKPQGSSTEKRDAAIAELVDMGFSIDQANRALDHTADGLNVRQAIDFIMTEAHKKATGQPMDEEMYRSNSRSSRGGSSKSSRVDTPEISKKAQDLSSQIFATGLSIFNQSKKSINKAIRDYTQSPAPNDGTPAWMRDAQRYKSGSPSPNDRLREERPSSSSRSRRAWDNDAPEVDLSKLSVGQQTHPDQSSDGFNATREAMALESNGPPSQYRNKPPRKHESPPPMPNRPRPQERFRDDSEDIFRVDSKCSALKSGNGRPSPNLASSSASSTRSSPVPSLSRAQQFKMKGAFADEEEMVGYVSPARRRQRERQPASSGSSTPRSDAGSSDKPFVSQIPTKPKVPARAVISISPTALDMATSSRTSGTESFKRGDYTQAEVFYSQALQSIPDKHLLRTIVLSNRSAAYMKLGDSKASLKDALEGLDIIGPGFGAEEFAEPGKPLKDIWSKLLIRKAEALEAAEKFKDSLEAWNLLIENGFSSKVTLDGKRRCQAALEPKKPAAAATPSSAPKPKPVPRPSNTQPSAASQEALKKIRTANQKAEKEDAERYQLLDSVEALIESWRKGKEENLRALLANLDSVLWSELGWKKVGMAELVIPKKVKLAYMKAVAKTHPDKIPGGATTEQKMIAQAVFVTINKAWDGFKVENGMN